jgi:hypothetical protein
LTLAYTVLLTARVAASFPGYCRRTRFAVFSAEFLEARERNKTPIRRPSSFLGYGGRIVASYLLRRGFGFKLLTSSSLRAGMVSLVLKQLAAILAVRMLAVMEFIFTYRHFAFMLNSGMKMRSRRITGGAPLRPRFVVIVYSAIYC